MSYCEIFKRSCFPFDEYFTCIYYHDSHSKLRKKLENILERLENKLAEENSKPKEVHDKQYITILKNDIRICKHNLERNTNLF